MIFVFEVFISSPNTIEILNGFIPHHQIITDHNILYIALGIIGATIMPHNLYCIHQSCNHENIIVTALLIKPSD